MSQVHPCTCLGAKLTTLIGTNIIWIRTNTGMTPNTQTLWSQLVLFGWFRRFLRPRNTVNTHQLPIVWILWTHYVSLKYESSNLLPTPWHFFKSFSALSALFYTFCLGWKICTWSPFQSGSQFLIYKRKSKGMSGISPNNKPQVLVRCCKCNCGGGSPRHLWRQELKHCIDAQLGSGVPKTKKATSFIVLPLGSINGVPKENYWGQEGWISLSFLALAVILPICRTQGHRFLLLTQLDNPKADQSFCSPRWDQRPSKANHQHFQSFTISTIWWFCSSCSCKHTTATSERKVETYG